MGREVAASKLTILEFARARRDHLEDILLRSLRGDLRAKMIELIAINDDLIMVRKSEPSYSGFKDATSAIVAFLSRRGSPVPVGELTSELVRNGFRSKDAKRAVRTAITAHRVGRVKGKYRRWIFTEDAPGVIGLAEWQKD